MSFDYEFLSISDICENRDDQQQFEQGTLFSSTWTVSHVLYYDISVIKYIHFRGNCSHRDSQNKKNEVMSFLGIIDDLYKVAVYHDTMGKSPGSNAQHPTLPLEFVQGKKKKASQKEAFFRIALV